MAVTSDDTNADGSPAPAGDPGAAAVPEEEQEHEEDVAGLRDVRLAKIAELRAAGIDPYPNKFERSCELGDVRERFGHLEAGAETDEVVHIAGRVMLVRGHGKLIFATLRDRSGELQLFVSQSVIGEERHRDFAHFVDRGDWIGVTGTVMVTKRGELSIKVTEYQMLAKAVRPLPDKWKGLSDTETRYRQRYVDLIATEDTRRTFEIRFKAIEGIRDHLRSLGYFEVETPALSLVQGGATAAPFITHYNALNLDTYLRIALELNLKRLIVGGLDRVFEIGRVFRNEGIDTRHNPEFTMLEAYEAFGDYHDMMRLTEDLVVAAARAALGTTVITIRGEAVDLAQPWRKATMTELVKEHAGVDISPSMPVADARAVLDGLGVHYEDDWGSGKLTVALYDEYVEDKLIKPTFVLDHPKEVSPLAKAKPDDPTLTERFELVVDGHELANAYSELNDPIDQLERFEEEAKAKEHGDDEAGDVDLDYVRALEYGLPPTGGLGIGIDRLIMLLAEQTTIREVILFPTLRPEQGEGESAHVAARAAGRTAAPHSERQPVAWRGSPRSRTPTRVRIVSVLVAIVGAFYLLSLSPVFTNEFKEIRDALLPLRVRASGGAAAVLLGVSLLYLGRQIRRRKRRAWWLTVGVFAVAIVVHVSKDLGDIRGGDVGGLDLVPELVGFVMILLLLWVRRDCTVRADPPSWSQLAIFIPSYLLIVFAFGFLALSSQGDHIRPDFTFGGALETIGKGFVGLDGPYTYNSDVFSRAFETSLLVLGIVFLVGCAILAFRPIVSAPKRSEDEWSHAERLVKAYGADTLAAFDLRNDKSFFFSSDGEAMIAYTYLGRTALASADPVGAEESLGRVLDEFLDFTEERGWDVAFLAVREDTISQYHARGLHSFYLGDEAIIHCDTFTLQGPHMKAVRQAVNRVEKSHTFELVNEADAEPELVEKLNDISRAWRAGNDERGFTMTLGEEVAGENPDFLLAVARDTSGTPVGFLRIVPAYGTDRGYTLDLMRHGPDAPNGLTEFLTAQTATALKGRGVVRLSMNFASWGQIWQDDLDLTPSLKMMRWMVERLNPYFQIKSLYDFNEKFDPEWLPRAIVVSSSAALPRVGVLFGGVEGFMTLPGIGKYFVPKVVEGSGVEGPSGDGASAPAAVSS